MQQKKYILVREFCRHHHLEITFVQKLEECGLVKIHKEKNEETLPLYMIDHLEKMVRLHQELDIHPEDLDVVSDLMDKIDQLQEELNTLRGRLSFFEKQFVTE